MMNALSYGGITAVIGMVVVFAVLAILIIIISVAANAIHKMTEEKKPAAPAPAPVAAPAPVVEEPVVEEEVVDDAELIAVIAAALAAYDESGKRLVVRKVRRVNNWNKSSRQELVSRF